MRRALTLAAIAALGLISPTALAAQDPAATPIVVPGARVRVAAPALLHPVTGIVLGTSGDSLRLRADGTGDMVSLGMSALSRVELSAGAHTHRLRDTGIGLLAGTVIGAVWGAVAYQKSDCATVSFCFDYGPGADAAAGGVILGTVGSLAGLIVGSFPREQWVSAADARAPVRVGIIPARDGAHGVALGASLRF